MIRIVRITSISACILTGALLLLWSFVVTTSNSREVGKAVQRFVSTVEGTESVSPVTRAEFRIIEADGIPEILVGRSLKTAFQPPDRLKVSAEIEEHEYAIGRNGDRVWMQVPHKNLAIEGSNDVPRFSGDPDSILPVELGDLSLPVKPWQLFLLPALIQAERGDDGSFRCEPKAWASDYFGIPALTLELQLDERGLPSALEYSQDNVRADVVIENLEAKAPAEDDSWDLNVADGEEIERVALAHLDRFVTVALDNLDAKIPSLPPLSGDRSLLASHGKGRLEMIEGTRVLFLEGSPEEMGGQHGALLKDEVKNLIDRIVYGVGVGSSFDKGRWFLGEIEEAQSRLEPFIDERYLREMDALAAAAGVHQQEARLSNFFPELFHCSGFALHGKATAGGRMFHGRILDYLRGLGLEQNAVVMIVNPDQGNSWVNVGYAGFVGSVTAMNEKQLAIGEMGGRGEGNWDGKPMAQLMREVMERADTIEEAVAIMEEGPRTCEYYYVISDAKSMKAVGIKATPDTFETVWSGESHPQLADPVEDTVLMSAGDRYAELVKRVQGDWGNFNADSARELMTRPVCMTSNIQSVLFAPDTLDFWVANADSENVASHTRYTKYNLRDLLDGTTDPTGLTSAE